MARPLPGGGEEGSPRCPTAAPRSGRALVVELAVRLEADQMETAARRPCWSARCRCLRACGPSAIGMRRDDIVVPQQLQLVAGQHRVGQPFHDRGLQLGQPPGQRQQRTAASDLGQHQLQAFAEGLHLRAAELVGLAAGDRAVDGARDRLGDIADEHAGWNFVVPPPMSAGKAGSARDPRSG